MCRWFVYISSTEPCLLEDVLVSMCLQLHIHPKPKLTQCSAPAHALSKQVHEHYLPKLLSHDPAVHAEPTTQAEIATRNRLFNVDGFGMTWYTQALSTFSQPASSSTTKANLWPALYKTIQPPLHDANFRSICSNTASNVVFAHIRAATSTAITPVNNHPFIFGIHTIMHNGYISNFEKIKLQMCNAMSEEAYTNIHGGTDTEHLAALFMTYLCPSAKEWESYHEVSEMRAALEKTIDKIISIQDATPSISTREPNDLNVAVTDGRSLIASRFRDHETEQPPSLYYSISAGVTLNRQFPDHPDGADGPSGPSIGDVQGKKEGKNPHAIRGREEHGQHVIVASEPTTYKGEWELIEKNRVVLVEGGEVVGVEKIHFSGT